MFGRMLGDARWRCDFRVGRRRDFGHARGRRREVLLSDDRFGLLWPLLPPLFAQFHILSDASAHTTEGWDQKPEPPDFAGGRKIPGSERNEY